MDRRLDDVSAAFMASTEGITMVMLTNNPEAWAMVRAIFRDGFVAGCTEAIEEAKRIVREAKKENA